MYQMYSIKIVLPLWWEKVKNKTNKQIAMEKKSISSTFSFLPKGESVVSKNK